MSRVTSPRGQARPLLAAQQPQPCAPVMRLTTRHGSGAGERGALCCVFAVDLIQRARHGRQSWAEAGGVMPVVVGPRGPRRRRGSARPAAQSSQSCASVVKLTARHGSGTGGGDAVRRVSAVVLVGGSHLPGAGLGPGRGRDAPRHQSPYAHGPERRPYGSLPATDAAQAHAPLRADDSVRPRGARRSAPFRGVPANGRRARAKWAGNLMHPWTGAGDVMAAVPLPAVAASAPKA